MQTYVVGFLFSDDLSKVVLIRKKRPPYQEGLLNGVGGEIKVGEWKHDAMRREFLEETGHDHKEWREYACISNANYKCFCYFGMSYDFDQVKTMTDEAVGIYEVKFLSSLSTLASVQWLVPLGLDKGHYYSESEHNN